MCSGRPVNQHSFEAFQAVLEYLESADVEQVTLSDLVKLMPSKDKNASCTVKYLKQKLSEHYGDGIIIADKRGGAVGVVTLRETASSILRDFHRQSSTSDTEQQQKERLLETAANLIRSHIKAMECTKDTYPDIEA